LDRIFWLPHRLTDLLLTIRKPRKKLTEQIIVLKFMGLGSLVLFANLCRQHHVDKSKITLLTFSRHAELCQMLGFHSAIFIRTASLWYFIIDCFRVSSRIIKISPSLIIDYERCAHSVSTFRNLLALAGRCNTLSFEQKTKRISKRQTIFPVEELTYAQLFLKGIEQMPKREIDFNDEIKSTSNKIVVNINASDYLLARRYPPQLFVRLVKRLHQWNPKLEFHFTGTLKEKDYVQSVVSQVTDCNAFIQAGSWDLEKLTNEIKSCTLFITGDSGPLHIAAFLNVPSLVIWGPTQPAHFGYENHPALHSVSLEMKCAPCFTHPHSKFGHACDKRIDCLNNLNPDLIYDKAISLLSSKDLATNSIFPAKDHSFAH